jgi:hypothetical protein
MFRVSFIAISFLAVVAACNSSNQQNTVVVEDTSAKYREAGRSIAKQTFETLSVKLQKAIKEEGIGGAINYCNLAALPLTDSLSKLHNATIRRAATAFRNPANQADKLEEGLLQHFAALKLSGKDISTTDTVVYLQNGRVLFAKPILLQAQCVACHGTPGETMSFEADSLIKTRYPNDRATGFAAGDLRGLWSISIAESGK